ncbi:MAG: formate--tetrahydrofolate ligase [Cytophagales bacterium]|nr:formate--tetrahydrofolate ligase [Cytophagales bacterium]
MTDIEFARAVELKPIQEIAGNLGIEDKHLYPYGHHMAKVPCELIDERKVQSGNLILVTAITPTKSGNGKTLTSVGLALGLSKIGKKTIVALREPSLGPCFGMKGGAAGGGRSQVLPMENINLHFTGDFHAVTSAHNMISAMLDNYQFQKRDTDQQLKEIVWKRVLDVNDRALRQIVTGLGGSANGITSESGFDITPASEIMAILCLAADFDDLRSRIENITLGYTFTNEAFTVKDLGIAGAVCSLLKDAMNPNLVQTSENTPALIHGGPFANIAHGCNSVVATKTALSLGDYVITEAGFGADLGAEKFFNIKCRAAGLNPKATVLIATTQALKYHGGVPFDQIKLPNAEGLENGFKNLDKHIENLQQFGQKVIVTINKFVSDAQEELDLIKAHCLARGVACVEHDAFLNGGNGAVGLAETLVDVVENDPSGPLAFTYEESDSVLEKLEKIARNVYGADGVVLIGRAKRKFRQLEQLGKAHLPVCVAKTQYSFTDNPKAIGVTKGFHLKIDDLILNSGAGFIVAKSGSIMRMPGLPKVPAAMHIDVVDGEIEGLS